MIQWHYNYTEKGQITIWPLDWKIPHLLIFSFCYSVLLSFKLQCIKLGYFRMHDNVINYRNWEDRPVAEKKQNVVHVVKKKLRKNFQKKAQKLLLLLQYTSWTREKNIVKNGE